MRLLFHRSSTGTLVGIDLGLIGPVPQRFTDTEFRAYLLTCGVNGPVFLEVIEDHPDGSLTLLGWVTLGNICILHNRMRHQTRHGSNPHIAAAWLGGQPRDRETSLGRQVERPYASASNRRARRLPL